MTRLSDELDRIALYERDLSDLRAQLAAARAEVAACQAALEAERKDHCQTADDLEDMAADRNVLQSEIDAIEQELERAKEKEATYIEALNRSAAAGLEADRRFAVAERRAEEAEAREAALLVERDAALRLLYEQMGGPNPSTLVPAVKLVINNAQATTQDCIRVVLSRNAAEAREAALRDALEFYADEAMYTSRAYRPRTAASWPEPVLHDKGQRARTALAQPSPAAERWKAMLAVCETLTLDAAGRTVPDLMRLAADMLLMNGGGPVQDCLRIAADKLSAALAAIDKEAGNA